MVGEFTLWELAKAKNQGYYYYYWAGQEAHLVFSVASYGKTRMNFLANPILLLFSLRESVMPFPAHHWLEYRWKERDGDHPIGEDHWGSAAVEEAEGTQSCHGSREP